MVPSASKYHTPHHVCHLLIKQASVGTWVSALNRSTQVWWNSLSTRCVLSEVVAHAGTPNTRCWRSDVWCRCSDHGGSKLYQADGCCCKWLRGNVSACMHHRGIQMLRHAFLQAKVPVIIGYRLGHGFLDLAPFTSVFSICVSAVWRGAPWSSVGPPPRFIVVMPIMRWAI